MSSRVTEVTQGQGRDGGWLTYRNSFSELGVLEVPLLTSHGKLRRMSLLQTFTKSYFGPYPLIIIGCE